MSEIQKPELVRRLQRSLGIRGVSPAPILAPEMVSVIIADDLSKPDASDVEGIIEREAWGGASSAAAVTQANCMIFNPASSGTIVTVTGIWLAASAAAPGFINHHDAELTGASATTAFRDRRLTGTPIAKLSTQDVAGPGDKKLRIGLTTQTIFIPAFSVLKPGQGILANANGTVTLYASFLWSERSAAPYETA